MTLVKQAEDAASNKKVGALILVTLTNNICNIVSPTLKRKMQYSIQQNIFSTNVSSSKYQVMIVTCQNCGNLDLVYLAVKI